MRNPRGCRKGFTLIELIAAIAVISVLAALAVNRYGGAVADGRTAKQTAVITTVEKAKELYAVEDSRTIEEIRAFNQKTVSERLSLVKPYIRLNGLEPTEVNLLEGTGKTALDVGKITTGSYTSTSGTSTVTIPAEVGQPATLN